jgi:hypothetical protein
MVVVAEVQAVAEDQAAAQQAEVLELMDKVLMVATDQTLVKLEEAAVEQVVLQVVQQQVLEHQTVLLEHQLTMAVVVEQQIEQNQILETVVVPLVLPTLAHLDT